jgi:SAM-dependent methyltransferase
MSFRDHFSAHAAGYAQARPTYPTALFEWLASRCARRELAWDAGCGNGQASSELARHFTRVIATDPSAEQIAQAPTHPQIDYRVEAAEAPTLAHSSIDLVTVAQAMHWFDLDRFHAEARRVLREDGVIAVWTYGLSNVDPGIDAVFMHLYDDVLGDYWPAERRHVENGYAGLAFPYAPIAAPAFAMECRWTLAQYLAYLRTWSATQRYLRATGEDPVQALANEFAAAWGDPDRMLEVRWPLGLRVGRVSFENQFQ